jgi:hypothetical protein
MTYFALRHLLEQYPPDEVVKFYSPHHNQFFYPISIIDDKLNLVLGNTKTTYRQLIYAIDDNSHGSMQRKLKLVYGSIVFEPTL